MANKTINDLFPSRFLKLQDIGDSVLSLTIDHVGIEDLGHDDVQDEKEVV